MAQNIQYTEKERENIMSNIRYLRELRNLSQYEFAEKIHLSRGTIANWETGISAPRENMLKIIAEFFHVNTDDLFSRNLEKDSAYQNDVLLNDVQKTLIGLNGESFKELFNLLVELSPKELEFLKKVAKLLIEKSEN